MNRGNTKQHPGCEYLKFNLSVSVSFLFFLFVSYIPRLFFCPPPPTPILALTLECSGSSEACWEVEFFTFDSISSFLLFSLKESDECEDFCWNRFLFRRRQGWVRVCVPDIAQKQTEQKTCTENSKKKRSVLQKIDKKKSGYLFSLVLTLISVQTRSCSCSALAAEAHRVLCWACGGFASSAVTWLLTGFQAKGGECSGTSRCLSTALYCRNWGMCHVSLAL